MLNKKRISFGELDAAHVYEWLAMYWRGEKQFGDCHQCQQLGRRLERFIRPSEVRRIKRLVARRPTKKAKRS